MTICRIGMQTHVYVYIFLMWTYNHASIILCVYVGFTFKWNVVWYWCMDCILIMRENRFADYQHDVCQVYIYIYKMLFWAWKIECWGGHICSGRLICNKIIGGGGGLCLLQRKIKKMKWKRERERRFARQIIN